MELTYHREGDYFLPDLVAPEAPPLGKYGMLRRSYLKKHRNAFYTAMQITGKLDTHLQEIDQQAAEMIERLIIQMAHTQGVTEEIKAQDQLRWVGLMNNIRAAAEEIVLNDLVYND